MEFTSHERTRYSRHLLLPEVGLEGQKKLQKARILCLGAGGLGSPCMLYLAAAGIGEIGLVDGDTVDLSNLQRQVLHKTDNVGEKKTASARQAILALNPEVTITEYPVFLTAENAFSIASSYDLIIDGSDNFPTRYLANDLAFFLKKPLVYGSVLRFEGQCTLFAPHLGGPCYRCLFPEMPSLGSIPSCSEAGVLGVIPGIIGTLQATEALKFLLGIGTSLLGRLLQFNALTMKMREFHIRKDPHCPLCGEHPTMSHLTSEQPSCHHSTPMTTALSIPSITVEELHQKIQATTPCQLIDVREPFEYEIARIPGSLLIPLGELPSRLSELNKDQEMYLLCRSGGRSSDALLFLQQAGFSKLYNVEGGILAWADRVDSSVTKY